MITDIIAKTNADQIITPFIHNNLNAKKYNYLLYVSSLYALSPVGNPNL